MQNNGPGHDSDLYAAHVGNDKVLPVAAAKERTTRKARPDMRAAPADARPTAATACIAGGASAWAAATLPRPCLDSVSS